MTTESKNTEPEAEAPKAPKAPKVEKAPEPVADPVPAVEPEEAADEELESNGPSLVEELEIIQSDPTEPFALSNGVQVVVQRIRVRETLILLKILTRGAGDVLAQMRFNLNMDPDEFVGIFLGSVLFSIPESEDETVEFLNRIVKPKHYIDKPTTPQELEANATMTMQIAETLDNPELDDFVEIMERLIRIEGPHILALGKRIAALLQAQGLNLAAKGKNKTGKKSRKK